MCTDADTEQAICVDLVNDTHHCGTCDTDCGAGNHCSQGICCAPQEVACFNDTTNQQECVDLSSSDDHCGACLRACGEDETCEGRVCVCEPPLVRCDGVCVDTDHDYDNCKGCGLSCDAPPAPKCVDVHTLDVPSLPGTCGTEGCTYPSTREACAADEVCTGGSCVRCALQCENGKVLDAATCTCVCAPNLELCGTHCYNKSCSSGFVFNEQGCACGCPSGTVNFCGTCVSSVPVGAICCGAQICTAGQRCASDSQKNLFCVPE